MCVDGKPNYDITDYSKAGPTVLLQKREQSIIFKGGTLSRERKTGENGRGIAWIPG